MTAIATTMLSLNARRASLSHHDLDTLTKLAWAVFEVLAPVNVPMPVPARVRALRRWLRVAVEEAELQRAADCAFGYDPGFCVEDYLVGRLPKVLERLHLGPEALERELLTAANLEHRAVPGAEDMSPAEYDWMFIDATMFHAEHT